MTAAQTTEQLGQRARPASETLNFLKPFLPIFGITRVADVTGLDRIGIPVALATRPNSRSVSVSQGKGLTLDQAKVSAVMESIETWHAENIHHPIRYASYEDLCYQHAIAEIDQLPLSAHKAFNPMERLAWIESNELGTGEKYLVPFELVNADYSDPALPGCGNFHATTNGLASGNTFNEAILQAMLEVIERDASTLWSLSGDQAITSRAVRLRSIDDPDICSLIRKIHSAGLQITLWEISSDLGIPVFACLIHQNKDEGDILETPEIGMGAHLSPKTALIRALTEAAQVRLTFISGSRDDIHNTEYNDTALKTRQEWGNYLTNLAGEGELDFTSFQDLKTGLISQDIEVIRQRLAAIGCHKILLNDLTREEFGISVARVIIPGLEGPMDGEDMDCLPGRRAQKLFHNATMGAAL